MMISQRTLAETLDLLHRDALVALASDLIRIPSVSPRDTADCARLGIAPGEKAVAEALADRLRKAGAEVTLQEVVADRPNLLARLRGAGDGRVLCFNGHLDTVGAFDMGARAFQPEVREGRLYGRGAADVKGSLACFTLVLETLARTGITLPNDIVFTAVIGEEGPPSGTEFLIKSGFRADAAIVGEPSGCRVFVGQRGGQFVRLTTHGKTAHGSTPHAGVNAIEHMVRLLAAIPEMPIFSGAANAYGVPSFCIGTINGGLRINVVPDRCEATIDVRMPPGIGPEDVLAGFSAQMERLGIGGEVEPLEPGHPAYLTPETAPIARAAVQAAQALGIDARPTLAPYWSDLAHLHRAGIPTLIIGPGSILQAHSADEYVPVDDLVTCARLYLYTALRFAGEVEA
ncbi:MAG: M20 family metallopeptidase [Anaerolineae bacterium]|nr:M20 family metallopeptidase [Anaerolineae bacterium]